MEPSAPTDIALVLAGKPYRLSISPGEEHLLREAAKTANERINQFQNKFPHVDKQDALALTLLQFARDAVAARQAAEAEADQMHELSVFLDALLSEHATAAR